MAQEVTHDDRLVSVGTSVKDCVQRIVDTFHRATDTDKEAGAAWYKEGERLVDVLAIQSGQTREHVAAVFAQLSPRTTWSRNVAGAQGLILNGYAPHCMSANVGRALVALNSPDPLATINGPKTSRFALNLLGDEWAVTVDVWAARVALGPLASESILGRVGVYEAVEECYRLAAVELGVTPVTCQATTWIVARNGRAG